MSSQRRHGYHASYPRSPGATDCESCERSLVRRSVYNLRSAILLLLGIYIVLCINLHRAKTSFVRDVVRHSKSCLAASIGSDKAHGEGADYRDLASPVERMPGSHQESISIGIPGSQLTEDEADHGFDRVEGSMDENVQQPTIASSISTIPRGKDNPKKAARKRGQYIATGAWYDVLAMIHLRENSNLGPPASIAKSARLR